MLSRHKPLEKIQPNLGCELLTCIGRVTAKNDPAPWGGVNRSNIIKFQLQGQFQSFNTKFWCVFSQMKDTKHIRRIFFLSPGSCPRGVTRGCLGGKN